MKIAIWHQNGFTCSTDKTLLQNDMIHQFLSERSYWAKGRTYEQVTRSIVHSLCFGIYRTDRQVGFARVVSDCTIYAYLMDVFLLEEERGNGLGKFLMECILGHPELKGINRWMLGTEEAHGLYKKFGFTALMKAENHMERVRK